MILLLLAALGLAADASEAVRALDAIDAPPGTEVWDRAVAFELLLRYDRDHSGEIDRRREVDAVPCEVLVGLDAALAERSEYPGLYATYGFPEGRVWLAHFLGFSVRVRERAEQRLSGCGLVARGPAVGPRVDPQMQAFSVGMVMGISDPGSPVWLERVRLVLVLVFDTDESGWLDTAQELRTVDCRLWQALDAGLAEAGEGTLVDLLGLRSDLPWGGDLVGIDAAIAPTAYDMARRCGLADASQ